MVCQSVIWIPHPFRTLDSGWCVFDVVSVDPNLAFLCCAGESSSSKTTVSTFRLFTTLPGEDAHGRAVIGVRYEHVYSCRGRGMGHQAKLTQFFHLARPNEGGRRRILERLVIASPNLESCSVAQPLKLIQRVRDGPESTLISIACQGLVPVALDVQSHDERCARVDGDVLRPESPTRLLLLEWLHLHT
eukprot:scaffold81063_cov33-Tisochrysis_lutea.AAC.3